MGASRNRATDDVAAPGAPGPASPVAAGAGGAPALPPPETGGVTSPADLAAHLAAFFRPRLAQGRRLCVGLSGGRDSVVLLDALVAAGLDAELSAIHVHHGLSPHAGAWADFCAALCARLGVPLRIVRVAVARAGGCGLEAAARQARYAAYRTVAADWLALAHHRDDQAETVLLNLLRGAGVSGLAAMPAERELPGGPRLVRPLLERPAADLQAWAARRGLGWVEDESNRDTTLRRNHLRHRILPALAAVFPDPAGSLARGAGHCAEAAGLLAELAALDRAAVVSGGRIACAGLAALSPARARNLLRAELRAAGLPMPDARWLDEALRQLAAAGPGEGPCLDCGEGFVAAFGGRVHIGRHTPPPVPAAWSGERELPWAGGLLRFVPATGAGIAAARLAAGAWRLAPRAGGERLRPAAGRPRRPVKKLLQEAALPPWERARLPFLWCGDTLVAVGGIGIEADWACPPGAAGLRFEWVPQGAPLRQPEPR